MNVKNLIYHGVFVLVLSSLLTGVVLAQEGTAATFPLGPMPKLIIFIVSIVISFIVDSILMLALSGSIYWFDYIAPASGTTLFTLRFMQLGDASLNYWIGINWIVVFVLDFLFAQVVFRFARGAAPSPNWQDMLSAGMDVVIPAILFIVLPMVGLF